MSTSLWRAKERSYPTARLTPAAHYDTVIVGAGFTGLTTALLLAREGQKTLVIESRDVGAGASGATTAKATLLQSNRLSQIAKTVNKELAADYLAGSKKGFDWLVQFCEQTCVPVQRPSAWTFARTEKGVKDVLAEHEIARELGLPTILHDTMTAPFAVHRAVELPGQLQVNPLDVLAALSQELTAAGGTIVYTCRVVSLDYDTTDRRIDVETPEGIVTGDDVVLATATPILDKGKTTVELSPQRSYLCSFEYDGAVPEGMLISVESPTRSLRTAEVAGTRYLLVGGNGHRTGMADSTQAQTDEITEWTQKHFPGARLTHAWSAQDYHPATMVPMVKTLPWGEGRIHFAGGYSKWGLTGAPAAAHQVTDIVLGRPDPHTFGSPSAFGTVKGAISTLSDMPKTQAKAALKAVGTDLRDEPEGSAAHPSTAEVAADGSASIDSTKVDADAASAKTGHVGTTPVGESIVDGRPCRVSLVCPHMKGILAWNDAEKSWDCPLHGSRFEADGTLIEGPATTDLERL
ncbi:FAD-dependent oxidoreductase [Flaviflexus huanghaiensis]|uniref:FAD-dependent oxidoreductase n=1 Tax=Flaviflexus huanghaiensis TaxID=1111473 RepID=UPI0019D55FDC|nr:FAD-dependent oxidoreductase [Flaviflexus huanghaiensis]